MQVHRKTLIPVLLATALGFHPATGDEVVLRDGRILKTSKPYTVKGSQAVLTLTDKSVVAVSLSEIDMDKTAALKTKPQTVPTPAPGPVKPTSPGEAARMKGARKATVVLTDADVGRGNVTSEGGETEGDPAGQITVGNVVSTKTDTGYRFDGSVQNVGKADALAVSVTIELVGENNKTVTTTFGQVAKDTLEAGEKSSFSANAEVGADAKIANFRYVPHWKVKAKPVEAGKPAAEAAEKDKPAARPTAAVPAPEATKPLPPGWVAPAPNAPVGAPSTPGGSYLPQPGGDQPKPPGSV